MSVLPQIVAIVGQTASGKSSLGLALAKQFDGEIIAADSRTVYRGMDIGTAKPEGEWAVSAPETISISGMFAEKPLMVEEVPHWGIDLVEPDQEFNAADFKVYAEKKIDEITKRGRLPILVGGTGLYIQAVVDNFTFDTQEVGVAKYDALQLAPKVERDLLYERINARVDEMIAKGLVNEVRALKDRYGCGTKAMTGIGYRQICAFFQGEIPLREAIRLIKRDTRHYAKRQMTWFKRDDRIVWVSTVEEAVLALKNWYIV